MTRIAIAVREVFTNSIRLPVCILWLLVFLSTNICAQTTKSLTDGRTPNGIAPGAPAGSYALSGFDNINLFNGNLNFRLPLVQVGGRGAAQYTMMLKIEQRWRIEQFQDACQCPPTNYLIDAWWTGIEVGYGPGTLLGRRLAEDPVSMDCNQVYFGSTMTRLTFTAPDGTEYELVDQSTGGGIFGVTYTCPSMPPNEGRSRGTVFVTRDGTAITFISDTEIRDFNYRSLGDHFFPTGYLIFRDGTRYRIEGGIVKWIRDRNGNKLSFAYDIQNRVTGVNDSLNRTVTIDYSNPSYDAINFNGFGGLTRTIKVWSSQMNSVLRTGQLIRRVDQLFSEIYTPDNSDYNPTKVSKVELPNGKTSLPILLRLLWRISASDTADGRGIRV